MSYRIAIIPGDGIGQEVIPATTRAMEALPVDFTFVEVPAGDEHAAETGEPLPQETVDVVMEADATLFGAAGETAADVILPLREAVDSFANVRPATAYPGVDAVQPDTNLVFIRENTEGVYTGLEQDVTGDASTLTRVITDRATRRVAEYAYEYASEGEYRSVTIAHKANVMRKTDGRFLRVAREVAETYPEIETADVLMDALAMHLIMRPTDYEVILTPNLAGDMLSDLAAGLVGGLGLLPSANIGPDRAVFEPVHGSAPDIAGECIANPAASMLSAAMLLDYLDESAAATTLESAVLDVLAEGVRTPDLGGDTTTSEMTTAVIERID